MATRTRRALAEATASLACLVAVLVALVSLDPLVRERMTQLSYDASPGGVVRWSHKLEGVADAVMQAARNQNIDNSPLLIFSVVAVVLVIFMLRS